MNKTKKNFIYNSIYQLLVLFVPLILSPYLSRVLGASGIGIYSYTYSIVSYFMILCLLGVNNYGNRAIAKVRDVAKERSKVFFEIYLFQLFMGLLMLLIYLLYACFTTSIYQMILFLQGFYILSSILDINWFFFGIEEFKKTILRNVLIKIVSVICIFLFVNSANDVWVYTLIMSLSVLLSQFVLWFFLPRYISFVPMKELNIVKHIKPNLILFIPVIAVSLYKIMDKIMLGFLTNVVEVGYYENADKLVHIPLTFITALGTVMLPKMSYLASIGKKDEILKYIEKSLKFVMFLAFPMCFGLVAVGYDFAILYFGNNFAKTGLLIMLLSFTLPFLAFANVLRTQYLIPNERDRDYIISVFLGALINFVLNVLFIPKLFSIGACIGTLAAEIVVMWYQTYSVRKTLPLKVYFQNIFPFLWKSCFMYLIILFIQCFHFSSFITILLQTLIGVFVYFLLNVKYIIQMLNFRKM